MSNLKTEKHKPHTLADSAPYVRPHVTSVKSSLFAEIDRESKNKRQRTVYETLKKENRKTKETRILENLLENIVEESMSPLDWPKMLRYEKTPSPLNLGRNLSTQSQKSDAQSTTSYASSYASTINIILHKENKGEAGSSCTTEETYKRTSIFISPVKDSQLTRFKRSSSQKSEPFCHSIFQTPSPEKPRSPTKLKAAESDIHKVKATIKQWDILDILREGEKEEAQLVKNATLSK